MPWHTRHTQGRQACVLGGVNNIQTCLKLFKITLSLYFLVFQVDIDSITPVSVTEEEFLKRKEAADTHDEEAAEVNIYLFFSSNHKRQL